MLCVIEIAFLLLWGEFRLECFVRMNSHKIYEPYTRDHDILVAMLCQKGLLFFASP